jgi:hypothetical protein
MIKNVKKKHTLYYSEDQIMQLKKISNDIGISVSDLIRFAINDYIKKYEKEK